MQNQIKLSLIIPIYGVENYIAGLLKSLLPQLNNHVECIFVNDGTKDKSFEILKEYLTKYPDNNYQLLEQENQGLSMARNNGMKLVKGEYFGFIDSDDEVEPNYIEEILNVINTNEFDIMHIDGTYIKDNMKIHDLGFVFDRGCNGTIEKNDKYIKSVLFSYNAAWLRIFNKKFLSILNFDKGKTMEDLLSIPLCYEYASVFYDLPKSLYKYYYHTSSITNNKNYLETNVNSYIYGLNKYEKYKNHPYLFITYLKFIIDFLSNIAKLNLFSFISYCQKNKRHIKNFTSYENLTTKKQFQINHPIFFYLYEKQKAIFNFKWLKSLIR